LATPVNNSVIKAFQILNAFSYAGEKLTLSQVARKLDINIATAHRFLTTLQQVGAVVKMPDGYFELGLLLFTLGGRVSVVDAMNSIVQPHVDELADQFGETIHAAILDNDEVCYVAKGEGVRSLTIRTRMGVRLPAYCTGVGKVLLSSLPDDRRKQYAKACSFKKYTDSTIGTSKQLLKELDQIRTQGYSVDSQEFERGLCCVAVAIPLPASEEYHLQAAISMSAPSVRLGEEKIKEVAGILRSHAETIANKLAARDTRES
jgi:IclR family transcriptional regulator, acetate operon repressor